MLQVTHLFVPGPAGPKCFDPLVSSCSAHLAFYLWWFSFDASVWGELGGLLGSLGTEHPLGLLQEKLNLPWSRGQDQLASCSQYIFLPGLFLSPSSDFGQILQFTAISVKMILIFTPCLCNPSTLSEGINWIWHKSQYVAFCSVQAANPLLGLISCSPCWCKPIHLSKWVLWAELLFCANRQSCSLDLDSWPFLFL